MSDSCAPHSRVRIVRGKPSDEELAAATVVLAGLAGARRPAARAGRVAAPRSAWANPAHRLRAPAHRGPDGWRVSAFPH